MDTKTKKDNLKGMNDEGFVPQTLKLTLKKKWYEMIESGEKTAEYRELKDYWCTRIKGLGIVCPYAMPSHETGVKLCQKTGKKCKSGTKVTQTCVEFRFGMTKRTMTFDIASLAIHKGNPEWGAPDGDMVININLVPKDSNK